MVSVPNLVSDSNSTCKLCHDIVCAPETPCDIYSTWDEVQWSTYHRKYAVLDATGECKGLRD